MASYKGRSQVVRLLLGHPRIDVNRSRTDDGTAALWMAVQVARRTLGLFRLLHFVVVGIGNFGNLYDMPILAYSYSDSCHFTI